MMKKPHFFLILLLILIITGCDESGYDAWEPEVKIYFDYIRSTKQPIRGDTIETRVHIGKQDFDKYFFMIWDHRNPTIIPESDFKSKIFVSYTKSGYFYQNFCLDRLEESGRTLTIYLKSTDYGAYSFLRSPPVIVSMPAIYDEVRFYINDEFKNNQKIRDH